MALSSSVAKTRIWAEVIAATLLSARPLICAESRAVNCVAVNAPNWSVVKASRKAVLSVDI